MNKSQVALLLTLAFVVQVAASAAQAPAVPDKSGPTPESAASQVSIGTAMTNNDLNKDGVITKAEATKAARRLIQSWDQYDLNKDDKVDKAELAKGLAALQNGAETGNKGSARQDSAGTKK